MKLNSRSADRKSGRISDQNRFRPITIAARFAARFAGGPVKRIALMLSLAGLGIAFVKAGVALADLQSVIKGGLEKHDADVIATIQTVGVIAGGVMLTGLAIWLFFAEAKKKVFMLAAFVILGLIIMGIGTEIAQVFAPGAGG